MTHPSPGKATSLEPGDKQMTGAGYPRALTVREFSLSTRFHIQFSGRGCLHNSSFYFTHAKHFRMLFLSVRGRRRHTM